MTDKTTRIGCDLLSVVLGNDKLQIFIEDQHVFALMREQSTLILFSTIKQKFCLCLMLSIIGCTVGTAERDSSL